jgi:hypothetical protein
MHPIMVLAFVLLAAIALAPVSYLASAPEALSVDAMPAHGGELATPNHDPLRVSLMQRPTAETAETAATPNHDPLRVSLMQRPTVDTVATPNHDPQRVSLMQQPTAETAATPNHDPRRVRPMPSFALNPVILRVEPEPAAPSAPAFVSADTTLYARDSARLRAAPSTAAHVLTKLAAEAPLRASARSTDGTWWRVSLADGRIGYVHRIAVIEYRVVKAKPPASAPVVADAPPQPVSTRRSQGLLGYVDQTMNWLAHTASHGSAPSAVRTER